MASPAGIAKTAKAIELRSNLDFMSSPFLYSATAGSRGHGLVFCRQATREFRQITEDPSGALVRCNSPEVSHRSSARWSRLEIAPVFSTAIMSPSAAHCGHQARREIRPCRINKELVSTVIVVCFAICPPLQPPCATEARTDCLNGLRNVL